MSSDFPPVFEILEHLKEEARMLRNMLNDLEKKYTQAQIDLHDASKALERQQIIINHLEDKFLP